MQEVSMMAAQLMAASARALGYILAEVAMGIPENSRGKNIYFDRPTPAKP